jgi:hypothetical protein
MAFEMIDNGAIIQLFGNVFLPELVTDKPVSVDGDLIAGVVRAPQLTLMHGSLIVPRLNVETLHADILGIFDLTRLYVAPANWTYKWLRPVVEMPLPDQWQSELSIERVAALFLHPALVKDPTPIRTLIERALSRKSCGRARVLYTVALELVEGRDDVVTPLGKQVAACFLAQERLPDAWRF